MENELKTFHICTTQINVEKFDQKPKTKAKMDKFNKHQIEIDKEIN